MTGGCTGPTPEGGISAGLGTGELIAHETSLTLVVLIPSVPLIVRVGPELVNCTFWTVPVCVAPEASV